jgi:hypothetical protein
MDLGLSSLVALSTGEAMPTPQYLAKAAEVLGCTQRSRKKRNSKPQRKAELRVASRRRDFSPSGLLSTENRPGRRCRCPQQQEIAIAYRERARSKAPLSAASRTRARSV